MVFGVILAMGRGWGWVEDLDFETGGLKFDEVQNN